MSIHISPITHITLRPLTAADETFAALVYARTRDEEMKLVDWSDEQKAAFLRMQFDAQSSHYAFHYPNMVSQVIEVDGVAAGRLLTENRGDHFLLMDIALLPQFRNQGIGTTLMERLKEEATRLQLPLVLRVEFFNPARNLYSRLGFVKTREIQMYHEMTWNP